MLCLYLNRRQKKLELEYIAAGKRLEKKNTILNGTYAGGIWVKGKTDDTLISFHTEERRKGRGDGICISNRGGEGWVDMIN